MNREIYQKFLEKTSYMVSEKLREIVEEFKSFDTILDKGFRLLYEKRIGNKLLKPTLFKIVYEMYNGNNFDKYQEVATALELLNISSYQANSSFDNKISVYSKEDKDIQFIASYLTREIITNLINNSQKLTETEKNYILLEISTINKNIYLAQHLDLNILTVNNFQTYKNKKKFFDKYIERCKLGSGVFSGITARIAFNLANNSYNKENVFIYDITEKYGTLLHMINDLGDYLPDQKYLKKDYQDNLSDFKNGRLTLPLYLMLSDTSINNEKVNIENIQENIFPYLIQTKSIIISQYNDLVKMLNNLPDNYYSNLYKTMLSTIKSNKYFYLLKN